MALWAVEPFPGVQSLSFSECIKPMKRIVRLQP